MVQFTVSLTIFFRIKALHKFLIADGYVIYERNCRGEYHKYEEKRKLEEKHDPEKKKGKWGIYANRLKDACCRESIPEINEVYKFFSEYDPEDNGTGIKFNYEKKFLPTKQQHDNLKEYAVLVIGFKILIIIASIVSIALIHPIIKSQHVSFTLFWIIVLFSICLLLTIGLVWYSLMDKAIYEDPDKKESELNKSNSK